MEALLRSFSVKQSVVGLLTIAAGIGCSAGSDDGDSSSLNIGGAAGGANGGAAGVTSSAGATAGGGHSAGQGGSALASGGAMTFGSGGTLPGSGGMAFGNGGAIPANGGAPFGSGGAMLGSGGAMLGSGGAMLGSGGAMLGSGGSDTGATCPAGFESELPLVITGATVPGNLELGLASAPETPRNPCGLPEEQDCFTRLNAERMAAGREPLIWDGDLVDLARSHAADRNQQRYPGSMHGSSTTAMHLYEQRGQFLGMKSGKFRSVVENAVTGARSAQSAVSTWMGSSGHAQVILGDGPWAPYTHAGCGRDGSEWNIEFGRR